MRLGRLAFRIAVLLLVAPTAIVGLYRFIDPPITPLMLVRLSQGEALHHQPVPLSRVSPHLIAAVIAAEDNLFCRHFGFDAEALSDEIDTWLAGDRPRGASTITMQTAKNILLWPGRDPLRKLIEAWLTPQIELLWSKRRILEVYLGIAEMGPGVYGAEAAARIYFHKPAAALDPREAALLAAVLPNPRERSAERPDRYVARRALRIMRRTADRAASRLRKPNPVRTGRRDAIVAPFPAPRVNGTEAFFAVVRSGLRSRPISLERQRLSAALARVNRSRSAPACARPSGRAGAPMPLRKLTAGFLEFQRGTFIPKRALFEQLALKQRPKIMMVACSDSRVDPAILTNAESGDLFMVRNVANLVPPCTLDGGAHGTSAALEFAVISLEVEHIIVLGHSGCGGIHALLTADPAIAREHAFIYNWMQIADEARRRTLIVARRQSLAMQMRILEQETIKTSLANLLSFPWINERIDDGRLRIHGWRFDLSEGHMYVYVPAADRFEPLNMELASQLQEL